MASFQISRLAARDLQGVETYTKQTWGAQQAMRYIGQINRLIHDLAKGSVKGRSAGLSDPSLLKERSGRHFIVFLRTPQVVFVSRVLHVAMDLQKYEFPVFTN